MSQEDRKMLEKLLSPDLSRLLKSSTPQKTPPQKK